MMERTMKKKSERFSLKKLAPSNKKQQSKINQDIRTYPDKVKSHGKNKSSQKPSQYLQHHQKFKIGKPTSSQKQRIKTQADQTGTFKTPYQKYLNFKKKDKDQRYRMKIDDKSKRNQKLFQSSHYNNESKHKMIKKLHLNSDLCNYNTKIVDLAKDNSLEKVQMPLSGKNQSFRKAHQSHRSGGTKKTALQKYISQSLQSLQYPSKKKKTQDEEKNSSRQQGDQTIHKDKKKNIKEIKVYQEITQQIKQQKSTKTQYHNFEDTNRKLKTDKDQSLQKFQIKFQKKKKNPYDLSRQEQEIFGDRFPDGFDKIKLLGRGGFSLVWLGEHKKSKKKYAIKQIITQSSHQTHIKEIWFGTYFFQFGGAPKDQFADCPGIKNLVKLYYYFINKKDTWILYEKCGDSLGNALYDLKGEYTGGQKLYRIYYKTLYNRIRKNQNQLRTIILEVAKALQLLAQNNIVHSDLKTQNILVRTKTEQELTKDEVSIAETKLIDYGSSFVFNNLRQFSMATPQYMAPQILNFILYENELQYIPKLFEYVEKYNKPWVIDVWSLGCVVLEIISGIPLWMSLKTIVRKKSTQLIKYGLFAIKGRLFDKIIRRQIQVIQNLDHYLYQQNYSGIILQQDLRILLKKMLALNPQKRISPTQIINYLNQTKIAQETV